MKQKKYSFDPVSLKKIKEGFIISTITALIAFFSVFSIELTGYLQKRGADQLDWYVIALVTWAAFSSGVLNAGKEWASGR